MRRCQAKLAARAAPVCTPRNALSPAQEVACGEHERLAGIVADCHRAAVRTTSGVWTVSRRRRRTEPPNAASLLTVRDVFRGLEAEIAVIVDKYADERAHLRKLWGGAAPGTIGVFVPRSARAS